MFQNSQLAVIHLITTLTASVGLIGCLMSFTTYYLHYPSLKNIIGRLTILCTASTFVSTLAQLAGRLPLKDIGSISCQVQALVLQHSFVTQLLLGLSIIAYTFLIVVMHKTEQHLEKYEHWIVIACLSAPAALAIAVVTAAPDGNSLLGDADLWCWISTDLYQAYQFYLGYLPVIIVGVSQFILAALILASLLNNIKRDKNAQSLEFSRYITKRLVAGTVVYWISYLPGFIHRTHTFSTGQSNFILAILQAVFTPAQGMFNFVAFYYLWINSPLVAPLNRSSFVDLENIDPSLMTDAQILALIQSIKFDEETRHNTKMNQAQFPI